MRGSAPRCPLDQTGIMGEMGRKCGEPLDREVKPWDQKPKAHLKLSI